MDKRTIIWLCAVLALALFCLGGTAGHSLARRSQEKVIEEKIREVYVADELDEWTVLTMAIMKTESEFDPSRIGATQDVGILQCTPIYVEEVNRILRMSEDSPKEYSHLDAFDIQKSIEMFNIVQNYHNKEKSISKAITQHNPGGASIGYGKRVYDNIRFIRRMEEARRELLLHNIRERVE